jgi:hypothetical protein
MQRTASFWEQLYAVSSSMGLRIVSVLLEFEGQNVSSIDVQTALQRVIAKHPILRSKMVLDEQSKQLTWIPSTSEKLFEFEILERDTNEEAISEIEKRAPVPIPLGGPYLNCIQFKGNFQTNRIAFMYSHAIMDGNSRNMFLTDFMNQIQHLGTESDTIECDSMYLLDDDLYRAFGGDNYREKTKSLQTTSNFTCMPINPEPHPEVQYGMYYRTLDSVSSLVKSCREHDCTVQAALVTSLTASASWARNLSDPTFYVLVPMALRPKLKQLHHNGEQLASSLGNLQWSAAAIFSAKCSDDESAFWEAAQAYKQTMNQYTFTTVPVFPVCGMDAIQGRGAYGGFEKLSWGKTSNSPPFTMIVSNVGRIESLSGSFGDYKVIGATAFAAEPSAFPFFTINTIGDRMTISVTYPMQFFNRKQIQTLVDDSIEMLTKYS